MRILFDKNVPVGVRGFLMNHEVRTFLEMHWPDQLENGELLSMAEEAGFDVLITSDQHIPYQQDLTGRKLAVVVLRSNIWPVVRQHGTAITDTVSVAAPGRHDLVEMPLPPKSRRSRV